MQVSSFAPQVRSRPFSTCKCALIKYPRLTLLSAVWWSRNEERPSGFGGAGIKSGEFDYRKSGHFPGFTEPSEGYYGAVTILNILISLLTACSQVSSSARHSVPLRMPSNYELKSYAISDRC